MADLQVTEEHPWKQGCFFLRDDGLSKPLGGPDWRGRLANPLGGSDWRGRLVKPIGKAGMMLACGPHEQPRSDMPPFRFGNVVLRVALSE